MFPGDSLFFSSLRSIIKKMHQIGDREMKRYGIGYAEMRILLFCLAKEYCRQEELAFAMGIDRTNVGRSLKKLEDLGYVVREKDPHDARAFIIRLSKKGRGLHDRLLKIKKDIESTVTKGIPSSDVQAVSTLLEAMDNNLSWESYELVKEQ